MSQGLLYICCIIVHFVYLFIIFCSLYNRTDLIFTSIEINEQIDGVTLVCVLYL